MIAAGGEFFLQASAEVWLADGNTADGFDDLRDLGPLAHVAKDASLGCLPNAFGVLEYGKQDDAGIREFRAESSSCRSRECLPQDVDDDTAGWIEGIPHRRTVGGVRLNNYYPF